MQDITSTVGKYNELEEMSGQKNQNLQIPDREPEGRIPGNEERKRKKGSLRKVFS